MQWEMEYLLEATVPQSVSHQHISSLKYDRFPVLSCAIIHFIESLFLDLTGNQIRLDHL